MGIAPLEFCKTKEEAYAKKLEYEKEFPDNIIYIFYEPNLGGKETPWSVNID